MVLDVDGLVGPVSAQLGAGFVRRYTRWAVTQTDAPVEFHVVAAVTGIATTLPPDLRIEVGTGGQSPNLFTMIVGESGRARKSWSMNLMRSLLETACPDRLGQRVGSYEGAIAAVAENPYMTIFEPEFSRFLSQAKGGSASGYLASLKTGLTDLYDCTPISRRTMKINHDVKQYRINLIGAISDDYLSEYTEPADFTGGFLSRWLFAAADRTRFLAEPDSSSEALTERDALCGMLAALRAHAPSGTFTFDPAARIMFLDWMHDLDRMGTQVDRRLIGLVERAAPLGRRLALMFAVDRMVNLEGYRRSAPMQIDANQGLSTLDRAVLGAQAAPSGDRWVVQVADLEPAMHAVSAHLAAAQRIVAKVEHTPVARMKAKVLHAIPDDHPVPMGVVTRATGFKKKDAAELIETLCMEKRVELVLVNGQSHYVRTQEPEVKVQGEKIPALRAVVQPAAPAAVPLPPPKPDPAFAPVVVPVYGSMWEDGYGYVPDDD